MLCGLEGCDSKHGCIWKRICQVKDAICLFFTLFIITFFFISYLSKIIFFFFISSSS